MLLLIWCGISKPNAKGDCWLLILESSQVHNALATKQPSTGNMFDSAKKKKKNKTIEKNLTFLLKKLPNSWSRNLFS